MTKSLNEILIDSAIWLLWAVLNCLDFLLSLLLKVFPSKNEPSQQAKPRVVIVGASFAGLKTRQLLASQADVSLVDYKEYFEYVPGALRCFVEPSHFSKALSCPLSILRNASTDIVIGEVVNVSVKSSQNTTQNQVILKDGQRLPFDYLVVAAGSTYTSPIKATPLQVTLEQRQLQWNRAAAQLKSAQTVAIVGAGAVGVELAGEILTQYPKKRVVMVDVAPHILTGFSESSVRYATHWLIQRGTELRLGAPLKAMTDTSLTFANGTTLAVDLVYKCMGAAPNTGFLKTSPLASSLKGPKGAVVVNDHLQVQGFPHVYCAGDMCFHAPSNELKLGHTAEVNAHLVADNILRDFHRENLLNYPDGVVKNTMTPQIYCISLGIYNATLGFNSLVVNGSIAAILKWLIEWTKVAAVKKRPIGILFWIIGDYVSNLLGRTLLPTKRKQS